MKKPNLIVIAHNIRSLYNVGAIFRTADALGVEKIYLTGYTATPQKQPRRLAKTALGAEATVHWEKTFNPRSIIKKLKMEKYEIIGLEYKKEVSRNFYEWKPKKKMVIILGNEKRGLSNAIMKACDKVVHLPMLGEKNSLNVSVAFGAIGYYILQQVQVEKRNWLTDTFCYNGFASKLCYAGVA